MLVDIAKSHLRIGRAMVQWEAMPSCADSRRLDGAVIVWGLRDDDTGAEVVDRFGGLQLRLGRHLVAAGRRGARMPNPARWRPRFARHWLVRKLAGVEYVVVPLDVWMGHGGTVAGDDTFAAVPPKP